MIRGNDYGLLILSLSAIPLVIAGGLLLGTSFFLAGASERQVTVVAMDAVSESAARPTVRWLDERNRIHKWEADYTVAPDAYAVGQKIALLHNPDSPTAFARDEFGALYANPLRLLRWSGLGALLGLALFLVGPRTHRYVTPEPEDDETRRLREAEEMTALLQENDDTVVEMSQNVAAQIAERMRAASVTS